MKTPRFAKFVRDKAQALDTAHRMTRAHARGDRQIFAVIDGPEDNYAVVDLLTAIESDQPYAWAA